MVDLIKSCAEINLHDPSLLFTLQCILQCMGHAKCTTCINTFPIKKLVSWKHTTAFHKSSRRTGTRCSNIFDNTDVMKISRELATENDCGPFGIGATFNDWPVFSKPRNYPNEQAGETLHKAGGAKTAAVLVKKIGNIPNWSVTPKGSKINKRRLTFVDLKA